MILNYNTRVRSKIVDTISYSKFENEEYFINMDGWNITLFYVAPFLKVYSSAPLNRNNCFNNMYIYKYYVRGTISFLNCKKSSVKRNVTNSAHAIVSKSMYVLRYSNNNTTITIKYNRFVQCTTKT